MPGNISQADLVVLARRLGIDRPIMSHRVVGSRVELFPLGGGCFLADLVAGAKPWLDENSAWSPTQLPYLAELRDYLEGSDPVTREELYAIARRLKLRGRSKMDVETLRDKLTHKVNRLMADSERGE